MQGKGKTWPWVSAAIIIIVAGLVVSSWLSQPPSQPGPAPVYAAQGSLIDGFPKDLILENNISVDSSYVLNYSSSTRQYTAQWTSPRPMTQVYDAYLFYFNQNHWQITNRTTQYQTFLGLYAETATSSVNVVVSPAGQMSQVELSYATK